MLVSDGEMSAFHTTLLAMDRLPIFSTTWWQALVATAAILFPGPPRGIVVQLGTRFAHRTV